MTFSCLINATGLLAYPKNYSVTEKKIDEATMDLWKESRDKHKKKFLGNYYYEQYCVTFTVASYFTVFCFGVKYSGIFRGNRMLVIFNAHKVSSYSNWLCHSRI